MLTVFPFPNSHINRKDFTRGTREHQQGSAWRPNIAASVLEEKHLYNFFKRNKYDYTRNFT